MKQLCQETSVARVTVTRAFRATKPALFVGKGADGCEYAFGVLDDGRCAISRDGKVMRAWDHGNLGVDSAVDEYCRLTGAAGMKPISERVRAFEQPRLRPTKGKAMLSTDELIEGRIFILILKNAAGVSSQWMQSLSGEVATHWYTIYRDSD